MPDYGQHFQDVYNRTLGKPLGRPISVPTYKPSPYRPKVIERQTARATSFGETDLGSDTENFVESVFGEKAIGGGTTGEGYLKRSIGRAAERQQRKLSKDFDKQIKQVQNDILEAKRVDTAYKTAGDLFKPSNPLAAAAEGVKSNLKYLDRPMQAISGVLMEGIEREEGKKDKLDIAGAFGGAWAGLKGEKHWDFGKDVVEEYFPKAPQPVKVGLGVAGNLFLDPLNLVGLGSAKYATKSGKLLKEASVAEETANAVSKAFIDSGLGVGRRSAHTVARDLGKNAMERTKQLILDIKGGGVKGRVNIGTRESYAGTHAINAAEDFRKMNFEQLDGFVEGYRRHVATNNSVYSPGEIARLRKANPQIAEFLDNLHPKSNTPTAWTKAIDDTVENVKRSLDKDAEKLQEAVYREVEGSYKHTIALRVGSKQVKIPFMGKAISLLEKGAKGLDIDAIRQLSHAGQFPGKLALLQQRGRSLGTKRLEEFKAEIENFAVDYNRAERKEIVEAIEASRTFPHNPKLQQALDFTQQHLKRMWDDEVAFGARNPDSTPYLNNYTYVWNKKGNSEALAKFKKKRKDAIHANKGTTYPTAAGHQIKDAAAAGFKPVDDAFDMLIMRQMKSNRDITRALFRSDLLENYGIVARGLNDPTVINRKLEKVSNSRLAAPLRSKADEALGDSWYLSEEMKKVLDNFDNMSRFTTDSKFVRFFRKMTNIFKSSTTVYNPGYHTRNIISDTIMGIFDGVGWKPYYDLLRKKNWTFTREAGEKFRRFHPKTGARIHIAGDWDMTIDELWGLFKENASGGGYFSAEFGLGPIKSKLSAVNEGVRKVSEVREDFGRVAHFLGALRQEYKGAKGGFRAKAAARDKAVEQAVYRVNHYKFDYGALTKWEQQYIKPIIPFYTFTRKAFPTVMENFMMNPKWIQRHRKLIESRDGDESKNFLSYTIPDWMRDVGYSTITDEKEPWVATFESLPTNVLQSVFPAKKTGQNFAQTLVEQINPMVQMPFEIAAGREIFSGEKIDSLPSYIMGKFGGPLQAGAKARESYNRGLEPWQIALTSRLGAGLPFRKVSEEQQDYQRKAWEDKNIEGPFDKFNEEEGEKTGVHIYTSKSQSTGRSSYKIRDENTGRVIYQGNDPFKALAKAKQSSGAPLPMSLDEWNNTTGKGSNIKIYFSDRKDGSSYRIRNTKNNRILGDFKDVNAAYDAATQRAFGG